MVKLFALIVLRQPAEHSGLPTIILNGAYDLSTVGFFQRKSVREFLAFSSITIVERTEPATRKSVKENEFWCHVYVRGDGLSSVIVADADYPHGVAHKLMSQVMDDFSRQFDWRSVRPENLETYKGLDIILARYQNPTQADAFTKLQAEVDETKIIMADTIKAALGRDEKLETLVEKSEQLSADSKLMFKTARKMNSNNCCNF